MPTDQIKSSAVAVVVISGHGAIDSKLTNNEGIPGGQFGCMVHFCTRTDVNVYDAGASKIEEEVIRSGMVKNHRFYESKTLLRTTKIRVHGLFYPKDLNLKTPTSLGLVGYTAADVSISGVGFKEWRSTGAITGRTIIQVHIAAEGKLWVALQDVMTHYLNKLSVADNKVDFIWAACREKTPLS